MNNISPEDFREELQVKIDCIVTKLQELETVHTLRLDQLQARVEELEQFKHDCETWQEHQRWRGK